MARTLEALQKQYNSAVSASAGGAPRGPGNRMAATNINNVNIIEI